MGLDELHSRSLRGNDPTGNACLNSKKRSLHPSIGLKYDDDREGRMNERASEMRKLG